MNGQLLSRSRRALPARRRTVPTLAVATAMMASVTLGAQAGAAAKPVMPLRERHDYCRAAGLTGLISSADNSGLRAVTRPGRRCTPG